MVLGPLLFLGVLETGLRVAGYGHPMSFFLPMKINGQDCLIENSRFGWRFFGPEMARAPFPLAIPRVKPPNTIRIFVFGESAALGDPQPEFGFARILQALLEGRYPDKHFEVVNTAMTAINSHVILPIARDCVGKQGDFWVIYMGNNEVVGPFGSGTVFGAQAANLEMVRAGVAFKATRIGQLLGNVAHHAHKQGANQSEWGGMSMFQQNQVRQDDPRMETVYHSFERNLDDIISAGQSGGAKVLVSTVARNLKDCGPFASEHRPGLAGAELAEWNDDFQAGLRAQQRGVTGEAFKDFAAALKIDNTYAEADFRYGQCLLDLGKDAEALRAFTRACDEDTLRFRADSRINDIIRRTAAKRKQAGVQLVDAEATMATHSPHGLMGEEFLYEHVHPNFEGNYVIARALAEQIDQDLATATASDWPMAEQCGARLGWNNATRCAGELDVLGRLTKPPFSEQAESQEQYQRLLKKVEALQTALLPAAAQDAEARTQAAVATNPDDWILQKNLALRQQQTGNSLGAAASWQQVVQLLPQNAENWQSLGMALAQAHRNDEAVAALQHATRLEPESVASRESLAELYASEGHQDQAAREFQDIVRRKPYWSPAHLGLGKALEAMGKKSEAQAEFAAALKDRISTPESYNALAEFAFSRGWYGAAVTNFADSLRLNPTDPKIQVNLGLALVQMGRGAEAKTRYTEALRLQPNFAEAHFCLGLQLGQEGDTTAAANEFAEAVRLKPEFIEAHLNLGVALANEHQNQQALEQFDEVLRRDPGNQMALARAQALRVKP
jgi:tetratricopeptide (TPR) repeat protein